MKPLGHLAILATSFLIFSTEAATIRSIDRLDADPMMMKYKHINQTDWDSNGNCDGHRSYSAQLDVGGCEYIKSVTYLSCSKTPSTWFLQVHNCYEYDDEEMDQNNKKADDAAVAAADIPAAEKKNSKSEDDDAILPCSASTPDNSVLLRCDVCHEANGQGRPTGFYNYFIYSDCGSEQGPILNYNCDPNHCKPETCANQTRVVIGSLAPGNLPEGSDGYTDPKTGRKVVSSYPKKHLKKEEAANKKPAAVNSVVGSPRASYQAVASAHGLIGGTSHANHCQGGGQYFVLAENYCYGGGGQSENYVCEP